MCGFGRGFVGGKTKKELAEKFTLFPKRMYFLISPLTRTVLPRCKFCVLDGFWEDALEGRDGVIKSSEYRYCVCMCIAGIVPPFRSLMAKHSCEMIWGNS